MATVTAPMLLDSTGQSILTALQSIASSVDVSSSTFRPVPFTIAVADWSGSGSSWSATVNSAYVTATSQDFVAFDGSLSGYTNGSSLTASKKTASGGGMTFAATAKPTVALMGCIYILDTDDGKVPVLMEDTVLPIANGGTGQSSLAGAKSALGIQALADQIDNLKIKTITSSIEGNSSVSYGSSAFTRALISVTGGNNARCGVWLVYRAGSGYVVPLFDTSSYGSAIIVTCDGTNATIANGISNTVTANILVFT